MRPLKDSDNGRDTGAGGLLWAWTGAPGLESTGLVWGWLGRQAGRAMAPGRPPHTQERPGSRGLRARTALPGEVCQTHTQALHRGTRHLRYSTSHPCIVIVHIRDDPGQKVELLLHPALSSKGGPYHRVVPVDGENLLFLKLQEQILN